MLISVAKMGLGRIGSPMSLSPTETDSDVSSLLSFSLEEVGKDMEMSLECCFFERIQTRLVIASLSVAFATSLIVSSRERLSDMSKKRRMIVKGT